MALLLRWKAVLALGLVLSFCCFEPSIGQAAPPAADENNQEGAYREAVHSALQEFDAGNFREARALFTRAHELYPNARTFRGLGFVAFELRNYIEAEGYLEGALSSNEKPLKDAVRRSTEKLLARTRDMIAHVQLDVRPTTRDLTVDGAPVELGAGKELVLEVGDHVLELRAKDYEPERHELKIASGRPVKVTIRMRKLRDSPARTGAAPAQGGVDSSGPRRWYKSPWLWSAVAIVVIGAGAGTAIALTRDQGTHEAAPSMTANTPQGGVVQTLRSW